MATSMLQRLKLSIPITSTAYDDVLTGYIQRATAALQAANTGIDAGTPSQDDEEMIVMYAAWLWRSNKQPDLPMPPALRLAINDRKVSAITGGVGDG